MNQKWARHWFAATALLAFAGIVIGMFNAANSPEFACGATPLARALNKFAYFTIQSNPAWLSTLFCSRRPA